MPQQSSTSYRYGISLGMKIKNNRLHLVFTNITRIFVYDYLELKAITCKP